VSGLTAHQKHITECLVCERGEFRREVLARLTYFGLYKCCANCGSNPRTEGTPGSPYCSRQCGSEDYWRYAACIWCLAHLADPFNEIFYSEQCQRGADERYGREVLQ
jgi:hypothetical protein